MTFDKLKEKWDSQKRERESRSRQLKLSLIKKGTPLFKKYGIKKAVLFGSVKDERLTENSDIDILVMPLSAGQFWAFRHELEEALDFPVDLYTESDDHEFVEKILERGETVYEV